MTGEKETRVVNDNWDLTLYKWKVEADGLALFVKGLRDRKVLGRKCHQCGTVYVPAITNCRKCFIDIEDVVEVGTTGKVATFTVNLADVRGNPVDEPQVICCVQLDGSDSWLMGNIQIDDWQRVRVGMPVKIHFREETRGELGDIEYYEPIEP